MAMSKLDTGLSLASCALQKPELCDLFSDLIYNNYVQTKIAAHYHR